MVLEMLSSVLIGPIVGIFGGWLKQKQDIELKKLDHAHAKEMAESNHSREVDLRKIDAENAKVELEAQKDMKSIESAGAVDVARMDAIARAEVANSIKDGELEKYGPWVRNFIGIAKGSQTGTRPWVTWYLVIVASVLTWQLFSGFPGSLSQADQVGMMKDSLKFLWDMVSACGVFWFYGRAGISKNARD